MPDSRPLGLSDTSAVVIRRARYEYRVRWQRGDEFERRAPRTAILQTEAGARAKAERLKRIDAELSGGVDWTPDPYGPEKHPLEGMPPLLADPVIERRAVSEWEVPDA